MVAKSMVAVLKPKTECTNMLEHGFMRGVSSRGARMVMAKTSEPIFTITIDRFSLPNVTQHKAPNLVCDVTQRSSPFTCN
jgi:hypothetical protein